VRGAADKPPLDEHARNRAARLLGHNRLQVTNAYLGSSGAIGALCDPAAITAANDALA